jgi:hypothetical protein
MLRSDEDVAEVGLGRPVELDPLDVAIPLRPARDIRPELPDLLRKSAASFCA